MEKLTPQELEEAFVDVRAAFRLLYSFQRRVMDIVQEIGRSLGQKFEGGYPHFALCKDSLFRKENSLELWAWDYLRAYVYDFHFGFDAETKIRFSVTLVSDTGFFDAQEKDGLNDRLAVEKFASAESSATKIYFTLAKNMWVQDIEVKIRNLEDLPYIKKNSTKAMEDNLWGEGDTFVFTHPVRLSELHNKEAIKSHLQLFLDLCYKHEKIKVTPQEFGLVGAVDN